MRLPILLLTVLLVTVSGCDSRCPPEESGTPACGRAIPKQHLPVPVAPTLTLYVSNQSFELDPVDIRIDLDDQLAISGEFLVEGQHTWVKFDFDVAPGSHTIHVTTTAANAELTMPFPMDDRKYGVVSFWYYPDRPEPTPAQFSFSLHDDPPAFD
jgi:hypothetical protein